MKILVVDDHPLICAALRYALAELQDAVELLDAADLSQALRTAAQHCDLDIILLDLELPDTQGFDGLQRLREHCPGTPVVVISGNENPEVVVASIDSGAQGFIPKSSSMQVMISALRLVLAGGVYVPPQVLTTQKPNHRRGPAPVLAGERPPRPTDLGLTERQSEVLALMVQGKSNKLICRELSLAQGTVKIHVTAILKALCVTNRTQAVIAVGRMGLNLDAPPRSNG